MIEIDVVGGWKKGKKMKKLNTSPKEAMDAFAYLEKCVHYLQIAKLLLRHSPDSKCYKAILKAENALVCVSKIQDKVVTNILMQEKNNECNHLNDKNSHT